MKKHIKLSETQLHNIIKESVNHILSELDWRTYDSAEEKARELGNNASNPFEKERRLKQAKAFGEKCNQEYFKQYNLPEYFDEEMYKRDKFNDYIDKGWTYNEETETLYPPKNSNEGSIYFGKVFKPTNGQLKRASQRNDDIYNYNLGKSKYKNGKWQ